MAAAAILAFGSHPGDPAAASNAEARAGNPLARGGGMRELPAHVDGEVIVRFRPGTGSLRDFYEHYGRQFSVRHMANLNAATADNDAAENLVACPPGQVEALIRILEQDPRVEYAEPNYLYHTSVIPGDLRFDELWALNNTGQTLGTAGADIGALDAWNISTGSSSIIIGLIDTGVDYTHEDLAGNIWTNPGEIAGNGIDDDGNGYVDDIHGINAILDTGDPFDDRGHGTHVAGTMGALGNNGSGVSGVNWQVRIAACKFLDATGSGTAADAIKCFRYFNQLKNVQGQNIRVTNNSWGGGGYSQALHEAMAGLDQPGMAPILHVAAAGNSGADLEALPVYPAVDDLDNLTSVAATDHDDLYAGFTGYGGVSVDLAAPGVGILSTLPDEACPLCSPDGYGFLNGTSMAAPHVAGAAALIWSLDPTLTVEQVQNRLLLSGDDLSPQLPYQTATGKRLSLPGAMEVGDVTPPAAVADLSISQARFTSADLHWTAPGDDGLLGRAGGYDLRHSTAPIVDANWDDATAVLGEPTPQPAGTAQSMTVSGLLPGTTHFFAMKVLDNVGNASALSNVTGAATVAGLVLFEDDMEQGAGGWSIENVFGADLWHQSVNRAGSPTSSWYYGIEGAYNYQLPAGNSSGGVSIGSLFSRWIDLPLTADEMVLVFSEFSAIEVDDLAAVRIDDGVGFGHPQQVFYTRNSGGGWRTLMVDISAFAGPAAASNRIRVEFLVNTNSLNNTLEGWYVDDVKVIMNRFCPSMSAAECDDGLVCNGAEVCMSGVCQAGGRPCAGEPCDEASGACVQCLSSLDCDDSVFCNGVEVCANGACQPGVAPPLDDGLDCTLDSCDEVANSIAHTAGPFALPGLQLPPEQIGQWSAVQAWPDQAEHLTVLATGEVLWWRAETSYLWNPGSGAQVATQVLPAPFSGAGHSTLADGRVLAMGGRSAIGHLADAALFDPVTETWSPVARTQFPRWRPTSTALPDGRVLVASGEATASGSPALPEMYDVRTDTWKLLVQADLLLSPYPFDFVLPDGGILTAGSGNVAAVLDLEGGLWRAIPASDTATGMGGGAVMYRPGTILRTGNGDGRAQVMDTTQPAPGWRWVGSLDYPRARANLVVLPDGTVLSVGGALPGGGDDAQCAIHSAQIWDPASEAWTTMASMQTPRMRRASAVLLPDGRVLAAGGENSAGGERNAEIYSPPYLFKGLRPAITAAPGTVQGGSIFQVGTPDAAAIGSVVLVRPGSVNHNFDQNQRYIPLNFTARSGYLDVIAPTSRGVAPPGHYMLFLVKTSGVPSVAEFVQFTFDVDADGVADTEDACPNDADPLQLDADADGVGDLCDSCPLDFDPGQEDTDLDLQGDACDPCPRDPVNDSDGDGLCADVDPCPADPLNPDMDGDGICDDVDACPTDAAGDVDGDGLCASVDPCPADPDNDIDGDGWCGNVDNCRAVANDTQADLDQDKVGDACDNCPTVSNRAQANLDADAEGDRCDFNDGMIILGLSATGAVEWQNEAGFDSWNLYRSDLAALSGSGQFTQSPGSNSLASRQCGLAAPSTADEAVLAAGEVAIYLVSGVAGGIEGDLGQDSAGIIRANTNPCP